MLSTLNSCCFTGHRQLPATATIAIHLEIEILALISQGVTDFYAGGALGFDTLAAQTILHLRQQHPQIRLVLILPCKTQAARWRSDDLMRYKQIKAAADEVIYTAAEYTSACMFRRNRTLVEHCAHCICYLVKKTGGTVYTVRYARKLGLSILNIAQPTQALLFSDTSADENPSNGNVIATIGRK